MLRIILTVLVACTLNYTALAADGGALEKLQGKWETKRTSEEGQKVTQTIELKKEKLLFKILDSSGSTIFVATADVKPQKAGAFNTFTISNIKAGNDEDSLEAADGDRSYVYQVGHETLTVVSNIDEERERPPTIDIYKKVGKNDK